MSWYRDNLFGKRITVLGAGMSGISVSRVLGRKGALVFLSEAQRSEDKKEMVSVMKSIGVESEFGGHSSRVLDSDWIVVSPGIPLTVPILQEAKRKNIPVFGEMEVASWFCKAPIVAVTGSNGKSTTTALIGDIFRASGRETVVAGNIGRPFSEDAESLSREGIAVVEVSSFQLESIDSFKPAVALYLNLTQDHLNRHGSLENYGRLKARIFENQVENDFLVANGRDRMVLDLVKQARSRKAYFGVDSPDLWCGFVRNGLLVLQIDDREETLLAENELGIRGEHNTANALAAALACRLMQVSLEPMIQILRTFKGLPHRLEQVREIGGVLYVNDSKATNVDSVWYALGSFDRPIVWIAGGRDKDSDFTMLIDRIREKVRALVLIGEAADKIEKAFAGIKPMARAGSFMEAIEKARHLAQRGDVVLLSPACASFDMFRNFEDRGDQFRRWVKELR